MFVLCVITLVVSVLCSVCSLVLFYQAKKLHAASVWLANEIRAEVSAREMVLAKEPILRTEKVRQEKGRREERQRNNQNGGKKSKADQFLDTYAK